MIVTALFLMCCVVIFIVILPRQNLERFVSERPVLDATNAKYQLVSKLPKTLLLEVRKDVHDIPVVKNVWIDVVTRHPNSRLQGRYYVLDVGVGGNRDVIYISEARIFTMKELNAEHNPLNDEIVIAYSAKIQPGDLIFFLDTEIYCRVEVVGDDGASISRLVRGKDEQCGFDHECPFFGINGLRGGCNSGYCELPDGVTRTGFKTFDGAPSHNKVQFSEDVLEMRAFIQYDNVLDPAVPF